jgi:hypothetical protein
MPTVKSEFVNISEDFGTPTITGLSTTKVIQWVNYDPQTGLIDCGTNWQPGTPTHVLSTSNTLIAILLLDNSGIWIETGLDQNFVLVNIGEGMGAQVAYPYDMNSSPALRVGQDSMVFTGTNLYNNTLIGFWAGTATGDTIMSSPAANAIQPTTGSPDGTTLIANTNNFGAWPSPVINTSAIYSPVDLLIANDSSDYNLNFKVGVTNDTFVDSWGMVTWDTFGAPTIEPLTSMGTPPWGALNWGSPFTKSPYAQYITGFTNDDCYQINEASFVNWNWNNGVGDPFMVQIICTSDPFPNFEPDRILFNVGTRGFDGFRIGLGDAPPGRIYTQALFLEWEYATEEFGPRVGTRRLYVDWTAIPAPTMISVLRSDADPATGAQWRIIIGDQNWFPEYGNDWPVMYWGNYFNCFLGAYHNTSPAWDINTNYIMSDRVMYNGNAYYALLDNVGNAPTVGGDEFWMQDVVLNAWSGGIWAARWVTGAASPFDKTMIDAEYLAIYGVDQIAEMVYSTYPSLASYRYLSTWGYNPTYNAETGVIAFNQTIPYPNYVVGTSGAMYPVLTRPDDYTITIATGLADTEVYYGSAAYPNDSHDVYLLSSSRSDGGTVATLQTPVLINFGDPVATALQNTSDVVRTPITQTLPPSLPTEGHGLTSWQTGLFTPPSIYHPSTPSNGPGVSPQCNPAWPSYDWSGAYHGLDANGYGIWDCVAWAPPQRDSTAVYWAPSTTLKIKGGGFNSSMTISMGYSYAPVIEWTKTTGAPSPGQWQYVDPQTIMICAPSEWPLWATTLMHSGNMAPSMAYSFSTYSATTLGYSYPYYGPLHYYVYDDANSGYGYGIRILNIYNGIGWGNVYVFCSDSVQGTVFA